MATTAVYDDNVLGHVINDAMKSSGFDDRSRPLMSSTEYFCVNSSTKLLSDDNGHLVSRVCASADRVLLLSLSCPFYNDGSFSRLFFSLENSSIFLVEK